MKKLIMLAAVLGLSASAAFSQGWEYGIKAGLNLATQTKTTNTKMRPGLHAGVFAERVVSDYFGVQAELLFSQMGVKAKSGNVVAAYKADYLALPVLARIYVAPRLSLDLGPQFGYLLSAKAGSLKVTKQEKRFDVAFAAGLSYKISGRYDVSARYNLGLTRISKEKTIKTKNSVIALGAGYRF